MELSISLEEHLARSAISHRRLCPRQVLGVRMARLACIQLGIDPTLQRKRIFVYVENGHCLADGIIAVTCASPTNRYMHLVPYGKMAATFLDLKSGDAVRLWEHPQCRTVARTLLPAITSPWEAHLEAYQFMADDLLLGWQAVCLHEMAPVLEGKHSVTCAECGDRVHEHAEIERAGLYLCKACAHGAYYQVKESHANQPHATLS